VVRIIGQWAMAKHLRKSWVPGDIVLQPSPPPPKFFSEFNSGGSPSSFQVWRHGKTKNLHYITHTATLFCVFSTSLRVCEYLRGCFQKKKKKCSRNNEYYTVNDKKPRKSILRQWHRLVRRDKILDGFNLAFLTTNLHPPLNQSFTFLHIERRQNNLHLNHSTTTVSQRAMLLFLSFFLSFMEFRSRQRYLK
jgi:hypothetical protein